MSTNEKGALAAELREIYDVEGGPAGTFFLDVAWLILAARQERDEWKSLCEMETESANRLTNERDAAIKERDEVRIFLDNADIRLTEARNALTASGVPDVTTDGKTALGVAERIGRLTAERDAAILERNEARLRAAEADRNADIATRLEAERDAADGKKAGE